MSLLHRRAPVAAAAVAALLHWPAFIAPVYSAARIVRLPRARRCVFSALHQGPPSLRGSLFHSTSRSPTRPSLPASTMDANGDSSAKRKRSSIAGTAERPAKHLKPEGSVLTPGDSTPANGTVYDVEEEEDAGHTLAVGPAQADSPEWQATIETVVKSVVSIHFCQTCSFDTELSMSSQATGFVVDAERGYILTNRHVVCAGPFWGYCIFDNHEEVSFRL